MDLVSWFAMMSFVIVDAWMQHPTPRFLEHAMFDSLRRWTGQALAPEEVPIDASVASLDAAGVHVGMLSAWHGPEGSLISNDEVAGWISEHPDRFRGLAAVDLRRPLPAVRELRRCVSELGFRGLRIVNWLWELPPTDRRCYPLYTAAEEMRIPVCLQVGHTGPLKPSEFGRPIPYVDQVAIDFPDLALVCGHIGYPWTEEMVAVARKHPNVVIDTSAYTVRRYPAELVAYLKGDGGEKVLWGTNFPMIPHEKAMLGIEDLGLDDDTRTAFLGGNAARVFGLTAPD